MDTLSMKILNVAAPALAGGLESVVLELASGLNRVGHHVLLAAILDPSMEDHPVTRRATDMGVEVFSLVVPPKAYHKEYQQLLNTFIALDPDVVHTHGYRADLIGGMAARRAGIPWVATAHGFTGGARKNRLYEWLQVRAYRSAAAVIAVSRPIRERLLAEGVPRDRVHQISNAWRPKPLLSRADARRRLGIEGSTPVIGWVGRLSHAKGADVFLEALALLPDRNWRGSIIGDGQERVALEAQARARGIEGLVRWHGMIQDAASLYPAFDAWVLSSRTEGTPIALFEAMGARVPIVVTAVGGVPDVVTPAEALIVPSERPAAIATALTSILQEPRGALDRAAAAYERLISNFGQEEWLNSHLGLYTLAKRSR